MARTIETAEMVVVAMTNGVGSSSSSSSESLITFPGYEGSALGLSISRASNGASSLTLASPPRSAGARGASTRANGNGAIGTRALGDAGDGDTDADAREDDAMLSGATMADWQGELLSSRHVTLQGH